MLKPFLRWLPVILILPTLVILLPLLYVTSLEGPMGVVMEHQNLLIGALLLMALIVLAPALIRWRPIQLFSATMVREQVTAFYHKFRQFSGNPLAIPGLVVLLLFTMMALFPAWFLPANLPNYDWQEVRDINRSPSAIHPLGLTQHGGDVFYIIVWGAKPVMTIFARATVLAIGIGSVLGAAAGFFRKGTGMIIGLLTDTILAFPSLLIMMTVLMVTGNRDHAIWLIAAWGAAQTAKIVRSETLSLGEREFIQAARSTGAGEIEILFRHVLANLLPSLAVQAANFGAQAVMMHASLTFMGVTFGGGWAGGIASALRQYRSLAIAREPWLLISSGMCLWLLISAFNQVGAALEDVLRAGRTPKPAREGFFLLLFKWLPWPVKLLIIPTLGMIMALIYLTFFAGSELNQALITVRFFLPLVTLAALLVYLPDLRVWHMPGLSAIFSSQGGGLKLNRVTRRFFRSWIGMAGILIILFFTMVAIYPQWFLPEPVPAYTWLELREVDKGPSTLHPLGLTFDGQDVLTLLVNGTRPVLVFGLVSALIATLTGSVLGGLAGYKGGAFDRALTIVFETVLSFPSLFMMLTVLAITRNNEHRMWLIVIYGVATTAKIVRAETLSLRNREYVTSAIAVGCGDIEIIYYHILNNAVPLLTVQMSLFAGQAILLDAYVNFLGVAGAAGWAGAVADSVSRYKTLAVYREPWLIGGTGVCLSMLILAFNMVGDSLRDALDIQHS